MKLESSNHGSSIVGKIVNNYFILLSFLLKMFYVMSEIMKISTPDNSDDGSSKVGKLVDNIVLFLLSFISNLSYLMSNIFKSDIRGCVIYLIFILFFIFSLC
jgi:hypothetical protein